VTDPKRKNITLDRALALIVFSLFLSLLCFFESTALLKRLARNGLDSRRNSGWYGKCLLPSRGVLSPKAKTLVPLSPLPSGLSRLVTGGPFEKTAEIKRCNIAFPGWNGQGS
jgi:hypothetical protein